MLSTDFSRPFSVIRKRFLPNGPFSAFFNDFEIFNGPFLIILHRLLWAIFQVNGTMAHGPLPSQSLHFMAKFWPHSQWKYHLYRLYFLQNSIKILKRPKFSIITHSFQVIVNTQIPWTFEEDLDIYILQAYMSSWKRSPSLHLAKERDFVWNHSTTLILSINIHIPAEILKIMRYTLFVNYSNGFIVLDGHFADLAMHFYCKIQNNLLVLGRT